MKLRKFYPSQVIRRLNGKDFDSIGTVNQRALSMALRRSRRSALSINIVEGRIDVRSSVELGRMILQDLKRVCAKTLKPSNNLAECAAKLHLNASQA